MTPPRIGRLAMISFGVRPSMFSASVPTQTSPRRLWTATTLGSRRTMPRRRM